MRKLLWLGDACCPTGFARSTHKILETLCQTWKVSVLGLNYRGDPHPYPYDVYPARENGGLERLLELNPKLSPDCIVIQNDPWNFAAYLKYMRQENVVGIVAVDGKNCRGNELVGLRGGIFWTQFGYEEAYEGGYRGLGAVIPLGVDRDIYHPMPSLDARKRIGLKPEFHHSFIVGNVNRNQPRKRIDLTIAYFAEWVKRYGINDAMLMLHVAPTGDIGVDVEQLASYYGVLNRLILAEPEPWTGVSEEWMRATYAAFDVQVSTTQGEGFGLTTLEGMACGVPQLVPDWSALGEWPGDAVVKVPCTTTATTFNRINVIGGIADREMFIAELHRYYEDRTHHADMSRRAEETASEERFDWRVIGEQFDSALETFLEHPVKLKSPELVPEVVG